MNLEKLAVHLVIERFRAEDAEKPEAVHVRSRESVRAYAAKILRWWRRGSPRYVLPRARFVPRGVFSPLRGARPISRGSLEAIGDGRLAESLATEGRSWRRLYRPDVAFTGVNAPHPNGNRAWRRASLSQRNANRFHARK